MTLLELPMNCSGRINKMDIASFYKERLYSVGICINGTVTKAEEGAPSQPIVVSTHGRNVFAISRELAAHIFIDAL